MKILITGTAGFIGFHLVNKLLKETDWQIVGLDNINDYYDVHHVKSWMVLFHMVNLKYARLKETGIEKEKIQYNSITQSSNPFLFNKMEIFISWMLIYNAEIETYVEEIPICNAEIETYI